MRLSRIEPSKMQSDISNKFSSPQTNHIDSSRSVSRPSSQQVAAVVKCAADNRYPVQAKSGGHSYGNYGVYSARTWKGRTVCPEAIGD